MEVTQSDVFDAKFVLGIRKNLCSDFISPVFIKQYWFILFRLLYKIFNKTLSQALFSYCWKINFITY